MEHIIVAIIGSFMNRVRGGLLGELEDKGIVHHLMKIGGTGLSLFAFFVVLLYHYPMYTVLLAVLAMFVGEMPGWGRYIGALGGWERKELKEVWGIDHAAWVLTHFTSAITSRFSPKRLWGFYGLSLRGLLWGGLIALPLQTVWPAVAGLLMGVVYLITIELSRAVKNKPAHGWALGEWVFGAVLWVSCVL